MLASLVANRCRHEHRDESRHDPGVAARYRAVGTHEEADVASQYFIPLTFTASLFSMNFDVLGQGQLPLWW
jgi:hypothetical protein